MKHIVFGLIGLSFLFYKPVLAQEPLPEVAEMLESVDAAEVANTIQTFSAFETRYYNSPKAMEAQKWLKSKWEEVAQGEEITQAEGLKSQVEEITQGRNNVSIDYFYHPEFSPRQHSLILTIEGCTIPEEIIVIGAHADSALKERAGTLPNDEENLGKRAPAADDNASGIAVITEVIRVLKLHNDNNDDCLPRTVIAVGYAAEEIHLKGSEHIANSFAAEGQNVIGVLNFDMTNFRGSEDLDLVMIGDYDYTDPGQNAFLERLIQTYLPEITWEYDYCERDCSDHASWHNAGYPASMFIEARLREITRHIHKATDTFEASGGNAEHSVNFVKLALAYVAELSRFGICRYDQEKCN